MAKEKKIKYLHDGVHNKVYVRAWKEKREIIVQVWLSGKPEGEPEGDWAMPGIIGVPAAVEQAILQTK